MPRPNPLTPAIQAAFLVALRGGATVWAAAASVGVPAQTLYRRRGRDPLFDMAWSSAAELSAGWAWDEAEGRMVRPAGVKRRLRFAARRRGAFLRVLERDCSTNGAARETGVHRSTVRRHLRRDPAFARSAGEALGRGYRGLERALAAERRAMEARLRSGALKWEIEPKGEITGDPDRQLLLLARYGRPDGTIGRRPAGQRRSRSMPFEEAIALLDRKMRWMGLVPGKAVPERRQGPEP